MHKFLLVTAIMASFVAVAAAETFNDAPVLDVSCARIAAKDPDAHTRECALQCQKSGFGIMTSDHKFLKFDSKGNSLVVDALKKSDKNAHLRVDVSGDLQGDTLKVTSLKLL
ncbi:MAG: hypothetical protein DMG63_16310 [Acidobacteria bacterium]|nr:MAG: hypothetical protein DMG63_16310 [Acidobacteriota bacterium]